jgi:hypothetical protein
VSRLLKPEARDRLPDFDLSRCTRVAGTEVAGHNLFGVTPVGMQVVCTQCHAVVVVEDVATANPAAGVPCTRCGAAIDLQAAAPESGETAWLVQTPDGHGGPYPAAQMALIFDRGNADWSSRVWRAGLKDWRPARRDPLLVTALASVRGGGGSWDTQRVAEHTSLLPDPFAATALAPPAPPRSSGTAALAPPAPPRSSGTAALGPPAPARSSGTAALGPPALSAGNVALAPSIPPPRPQPFLRLEPGLAEPTPSLAEPTFADVLRSAPSVLTALPTLESVPPRALPRRAGLQSWLPSPQSMLLVAVLAFVSGVLAAALWGRAIERQHARASTLLTGASSLREGTFAAPAPAVLGAAASVRGADPAPVAADAVPEDGRARAAPPPGAGVAPLAVAAPQAAAPAVEAAGLRELPEPAEVARELKVIWPDVRRCVGSQPRAVDVEVLFDGASGLVTGVNLHTSRLTAGEVECITQALRQMRVSAFRSAEHKLGHRFAF